MFQLSIQDEIEPTKEIYHRELIYRAVLFFVSRLRISTSPFNFGIEVIYKELPETPIPGTGKVNTNLGGVIYEEVRNEKFRLYILTLNRKRLIKNIEKLLFTLAHEVVHIDQYQDQRLTATSYVIKEGEYSLDNILKEKVVEKYGIERWFGRDVTNVLYEKRPQEIEANRIGSELIRAYKQFN